VKEHEASLIDCIQPELLAVVMGHFQQQADVVALLGGSDDDFPTATRSFDVRSRGRARGELHAPLAASVLNRNRQICEPLIPPENAAAGLENDHGIGGIQQGFGSAGSGIAL
jgi:hypothetical protein